jgi:GT2 family glycosyltransferase
MGPPRISVCIANFNGEAMLADCIESVLAQDTDATIEILVHDDASTDASLDLLRHRYPEVRVIASATNVGFCIANNRMVASAKGEFVLLLNNDAALFPDAAREFLSTSEAVGTPAILTVPQHDWATGALVDRGCMLDPFHTPVPNLDARCPDVAYVIGACLWIPRATWHELGGFPSWFGSIAEDMHLCCAARLRGIPVRCIDASGYRHRQGTSFGGNRLGDGRLQTRYNRRYLSERNRIAVLASCVPTLLAWPWLAAHAAGLLLEAFVACLVSRSTAPWRRIYRPALRDALALRRDIFKLRRACQAGHCISLASYLRVFCWTSQKLKLFWRHGPPELKD